MTYRFIDFRGERYFTIDGDYVEPELAFRGTVERFAEEVRSSFPEGYEVRVEYPYIEVIEPVSRAILEVYEARPV